MEYDDSDFGSQNPQLNSEEVSKSSPVLSTYSLPKYDFDDGLHGDIRFDSLVETETFLGIESQEDTSWIDDFSRGSSRIEFSSRDAEPASILRRNNVWSEATSLESVEMLLKSVGQDDLINGETVVQDRGAVQGLGSSTLQLTPNEEDRDGLFVENVSSGLSLPVDECVQKLPDADAVKRHSTEDVSGKLVGSGNTVDSLLQEIGAETIQSPVTLDTQAMSEDDNPSVAKKPELNQIKAVSSFKRQLQEYVQGPLLQAKSQVNYPQTTTEFTENLSAGLNQGNDSGNQLNQNLQVTGTQDFSEGPSNVNAEGVDDMVLKKEFNSKRHTADNTAGDLENVASSEHLDIVSGGEPGTEGTGNSHMKEPRDSPTEELHDFNSMEIGLSQIDTSNPAEDRKFEIDKHMTNSCKGSSVTLEGGSAFVGHSAEVTTPNSGTSHDEKLCSDALETDSAGENNNELCASAEHNENPEQSLVKDDQICGAGVEEDELCGVSEQMENTVALTKPEKSLTENDEGIPSGESEMASELAVDRFSPNKVCSSAVLASAAQATEDSSIFITPPVSEEQSAKVINISTSATVDRDTIETTASADMIDGHDKCMDTIISVQSNSEASSVDEKICCTGGLLINDTRVASPVENVCHTSNEGTPCDSPSAIPPANGRDYEEPETAPLIIRCGGDSKDDAVTEKSIQYQFDKSATAGTYDGSVLPDPKASDASDNDKTFSFIITSSAEHSERETLKLWQPFTSQVPVSSQNVEDSPLTPRVEQINLGNQGSHQTTDVQVVTGSKSMSVRKPRKASGKTSKESAKKESRRKPTTPSKLKESNIFPTIESGLPDLNRASSLPMVHLQLFTDLQQLQLRAQIFVYGSLIQGTPPDEACMVAAFGGADGGRSIWENARQRCLERFQGQKSQNSNPETPSQQHSSVRTADQKSKTSKTRTKSNALTLGKASKSTPIHTTVSQLTPPASPLWTLNTPERVHIDGMPSRTLLEHNVHPQLYPHSSSPLVNTVVHTSSWSPHPAHWVTSPQPAAPKASPSLMMRTKMEPVILTPVRESSMSEISVRHSSPGPIAHPVCHNNAILGAPSPLIDDRTLIWNPGQTLSDSKTRKRKKVELSEASTPMVTEPQHKFELASAACVSSILPTTVATPNSESKLKTDVSSLATAIASSGDHSTKGNIKADDRIMLSDDMCYKVDEAKLHAEDAAAYSVAAVDLSQEMWSQLAKQKDSEFAPDAEAKISSAALAIAAAVAVAKAAAAAAKVASDAAIQAKLMAEEAMGISRKNSLVYSTTEISLNSSACSLGNAMPSLNSGSSLAGGLAALEKIGSALAASKQAENLNAIVKAAELAAEAVKQAGKVALMGNPLPLSELANAGPEGCWKLTFERELRSNTVIDCDKVDANKGGANTFETVRETTDIPKTQTDDCSLEIIPGDECEPTSVDPGNKVDKPLGTAENPIKEGASVEIYKEGDSIKAAWFSANVLELKNGEAYVCYMEKPPSDGDSKEWIKLDIQGNEVPKIRAAHPMTAMPTEGTRKRRREAMGKCFWSVGDRVDAWRQNCWWEGTITEKSSKDDTAFTVHFSAQGEISIIKACHLRPSLIWQDGKWVEWSSSTSDDGVIRQEKRMKLCDPEHEVEGNEKASENVDPTETKIQEDSRLLGLSDNEKTFNVGKSSKDVKKPLTHRMARTGLQNEGKTVSVGVPKPGKKRKFMDVSQHYVSRDSKTNESNDSTIRAKMLIPKGSGLPGWKNSTRIDLQEKKVPATKQVPNSRKPAAVHDRTLDKNNVSSSVSRNDNAFRSLGVTGFASFSSIGRSRNSPFEFSSTSNDKSSKKMLSSASSKPVLSSKTRFEPPAQRLGKIEENRVYNSTAGSSMSDGAEPRRSNRRIQPTSRLLEGLQTSLSNPKLPSVSHDKGLKRNASSRGNH